MKGLPYTADVSHCMGNRRKICTRCYRYKLMRMWEQTPVEEREAILLFPGKADASGCATFFDEERVQNLVEQIKENY